MTAAAAAFRLEHEPPQPPPGACVLSNAPRQRLENVSSLRAWLDHPELEQERDRALHTLYVVKQRQGGCFTLQPFKFTDKAWATLWAVYCARHGARPQGKTERLARELLGWAARAYLQGRAWYVEHGDLEQLLPGYALTTGARLFKALHAAAIVERVPTFDERAAVPGKHSRRGNLIRVDATCFLHAAISETIRAQGDREACAAVQYGAELPPLELLDRVPSIWQGVRSGALVETRRSPTMRAPAPETDPLPKSSGPPPRKGEATPAAARPQPLPAPSAHAPPAVAAPLPTAPTTAPAATRPTRTHDDDGASQDRTTGAAAAARPPAARSPAAEPTAPAPSRPTSSGAAAAAGGRWDAGPPVELLELVRRCAASGPDEVPGRPRRDAREAWHRTARTCAAALVGELGDGKRSRRLQGAVLWTGDEFEQLDEACSGGEMPHVAVERVLEGRRARQAAAAAAALEDSAPPPDPPPE